MAPLRASSVRLVLVVAALAAGACDRNRSSDTQPPAADPASDAVTLRYATPDPAQTLAQTLELQLTDTRVGQYLEVELGLDATLELRAAGEGLRTSWSLAEVGTLELAGTVDPDEVERTRALLLAHGRGAGVSDARGATDPAAPEAAAAGPDALDADAPRSAVLLLAVLVEQLRLPRLPAQALRVGETVELEEESETVVTDAELVLPTTTVHRFTLRRLDDSGATRVAEIAFQIASVAEPEDGAEVEARLEARTEGTVLLDVDRGVPVSVELSRTESFRVGEAEGERSVLVRSRYRSP